MQVKFYLAGKFRDGKKLLKHVETLEDLGHQCTHKWMLFEGATSPEKAINDVNGVYNADYLLAFLTDPEYRYRGTMSEIGVALGYNNVANKCDLVTKSIYIVKHPDAKFSCFIHHPSVQHFTSFEKALDQIMTDWQ